MAMVLYQSIGKPEKYAIACHPPDANGEIIHIKSDVKKYKISERDL